MLGSTEENDDERTIEEFFKELKVDGRFFTGNPRRVSYIKNHQEEIENYLDYLEETNPSESRLYRELVYINSKPARRRIMDLSERIEMRGNIISNDSKKEKNTISRYDSRPRKNVERLILPIITFLAIGGAFYLGEKFKVEIEKIVGKYTAPIFKMYDDIDNRR